MLAYLPKHMHSTGSIKELSHAVTLPEQQNGAHACEHPPSASRPCRLQVALHPRGAAGE